MKKIWIVAIVNLLISSVLYAQDYSLPVPPRKFFVQLSKTELTLGDYCCDDLRRMLNDSITISPYLAAKLFRKGKILIGDARPREGYKNNHILGAICLPFNEVDFMKLRPINIPIALY